MDIVATVVGLGIAAFLLLYFIRTLKENEHDFLKLFVLFLFITLLILIPKSLIDNNDYCEFVPILEDDIYVYGNNFTDYHWDYDFDAPSNAKLEEQAFLFHHNKTITYDYICETNNDSTSLIFYKIISYMMIFVWTYTGIYLFWFGMKSLIERLHK